MSSEQVRQVASADFPTRWGKFRIYGFRGEFGTPELRREEDAVALVMGDIHSAPPLLRIHSQCLTGDVFGSLRCDCREQLEIALAMIAEEGAGILIYEQQEGRGIGLLNKLKAYELQDAGKDTVEANHALGFRADLRHYGIGAQILVDLGVKNLKILTNNPKKIVGIEGYGLKVVERLPLEVPATDANRSYLRTKREKLGHLFSSFPD